MPSSRNPQQQQQRQYGASARRSNSGNTGTTTARPARSSFTSEDEYVAQQLQDQYRQEFLDRQAQKNRQGWATAPFDYARRAQAQPPPPPSSGVTYETVVNQRPVAVPPSAKSRSSSRTSSRRSKASPRSQEAASMAAAFPHSADPDIQPLATVFASASHDEIEIPLTAMDDEVYARQLQDDIAAEEAAMAAGRRMAQASNHQPLDYNDADAKYAQQLQDEEVARRYSEAAPAASSPFSSGWDKRRGSSAAAAAAATTGRVVKGKPAIDIDIDHYLTTSTETSSGDEASRQIAQELQDAEMAQRLTVYEQEAESRRVVQSQQQQMVGQTRRSKLLGRLLPLLCCGAAVAVALLFILGVFNPENVPFVGDALGGDDWVDPFAGGGIGGDVTFGGGGSGQTPIADPNNPMAWSNSGRGISLEILNALDDSWQSIFATAMENWDQGYPIDSLTLRATRVSYDMECTGVTGKLKVCNGDYGPNRWRGLNELMLIRRSNTIVSSAAKMNEFYLQNGGNSREADQQLYTMCHELGHGFGLPHWDEDFFNEDSGNCMDYTNNPGSNKWPDASNFLYLNDVYGGVNVTALASEISRNEVTEDRGDRKGNNKGQRRQQQQRPQPHERRTKALRRQRKRSDHWDQDPTAVSPPRTPQRRLAALLHRATSLEDGTATTVIPLKHSKVVLPVEDDAVVRATTDSAALPQDRRERRLILEANEHFEIHRVLVSSSEGGYVDDDLVKLEFYFMATE